MSKVIEVSSMSEIEEIIANNSKVILDFAAQSWCVPCQRLKPHYDKASETVEDVTWVHADIDLYPALATVYNIQSVPTVHAYKDGVYVEPVEARTVIKLVEFAKNL